MPTDLLSQLVSPVPEPEHSLSDDNSIGIGGGPGDPGSDPHENSELEPEPQVTPLSAYRMFTFLAIIWIVALFATLALVLESRWVYSKDWVSIPLPHILYVNTGLLLISSLTIEFARSSLRAEAGRRCTRWILLTLLLGLAFVGGQIVAWLELSFRGLHLASNPGSFFFYLITGAHGVHLLVGIISLASLGLSVSQLAQKFRQQTAMDTVALYWHFMNGLWVCLLALLLITIQL
jgi:cytochrome c oxidase subunit III